MPPTAPLRHRRGPVLATGPKLCSSSTAADAGSPPSRAAWARFSSVWKRTAVQSVVLQVQLITTGHRAQSFRAENPAQLGDVGAQGRLGGCRSRVFCQNGQQLVGRYRTVRLKDKTGAQRGGWWDPAGPSGHRPARRWGPRCQTPRLTLRPSGGESRAGVLWLVVFRSPTGRGAEIVGRFNGFAGINVLTSRSRFHRARRSTIPSPAADCSTRLTVGRVVPANRAISSWVNGIMAGTCPRP